MTAVTNHASKPLAAPVCQGRLVEALAVPAQIGNIDGVTSTPGAARPIVEIHDGRFQRSMRTRLLVLDAFLALIEEGDLAPTSQRIAERAGVSMRTVFHQFNDVDTIHQLAGQRLSERLRAEAHDVSTQGPLARRIDAFVDNRVHLHQIMSPQAAAARLREPFSRTLRRNRESLIHWGESEIRAVFGRELKSLPPASQDKLVAAVALVSNWTSWYSMTEELGLDADAAADVLRTSLRALLGSRTVFLNQSG